MKSSVFACSNWAASWSTEMLENEILFHLHKILPQCDYWRGENAKWLNPGILSQEHFNLYELFCEDDSVIPFWERAGPRWGDPVWAPF